MIFLQKNIYFQKNYLNIVITLKIIEKISHFYFIFTKLKSNNNTNFKDIPRI